MHCHHKVQSIGPRFLQMDTKLRPCTRPGEHPVGSRAHHPVQPVHQAPHGLTMPDGFKGCAVNDKNNNSKGATNHNANCHHHHHHGNHNPSCFGGGGGGYCGGGGGGGGGGAHRRVQVTAKILFGSVSAISKLILVS
ncbi:hypothetical protein FOCC_FOCC011740 [Frankliniella occidentalis]|nr:hypothetical protein FOCC_FOCC011740 [Frankliniella occidentalis]